MPFVETDYMVVDIYIGHLILQSIERHKAIVGLFCVHIKNVLIKWAQYCKIKSEEEKCRKTLCQLRSRYI